MALKHNITKPKKVIKIEEAKYKNCWRERDFVGQGN
jgi:hypothetical protein